MVLQPVRRVMGPSSPIGMSSIIVSSGGGGIQSQVPSHGRQRVPDGQVIKRQGSSAHLPARQALVPLHCSSAAIMPHSGSRTQCLTLESQTVPAGQALGQGSLAHEPIRQRVPRGQGLVQARMQLAADLPSV